MVVPYSSIACIVRISLSLFSCVISIHNTPIPIIRDGNPQVMTMYCLSKSPRCISRLLVVSSYDVTHLESFRYDVMNITVSVLTLYVQMIRVLCVDRGVDNIVEVLNNV